MRDLSVKPHQVGRNYVARLLLLNIILFVGFFIVSHFTILVSGFGLGTRDLLVNGSWSQAPG